MHKTLSYVVAYVIQALIVFQSTSLPASRQVMPSFLGASYLKVFCMASF